MRLALVFKRLSLQGGSERHVYMLARDLAREGHEVHLYCRDLLTEPPDGVVVHRMPQVPLGSGVGRLVFSAWARRAVTATERRLGPFDVKHGFGRTPGQDVYRMGGGCHDMYLDHAHALEYPFWLRRILRGAPLQRLKSALEARMLGGLRPPHVITNSEMSADDLVHRYGLAPELVHVVRNGIDLERFHMPRAGEREEVRRSWGFGERHEVLLFLGSAYSRKGLEVLLRATAAAAEVRPAIRLVVGGQDHRAHRWHRMAERLGVDDRVLWLGAVSDPERCYRGADLYVLPTRYDPAANSTLEALASGLPVVTSAMNGAAEIVVDGVHGAVLSTPVHPDELTEALLAWLERARDEDVRIGARLLAERFPAHSSCESTLDVYRAVLEDRLVGVTPGTSARRAPEPAASTASGASEDRTPPTRISTP